MISKTNVEIDRLRKTAQDENETPLEQIKAAFSLLRKFGPTQRNQPIIRGVFKKYVKSLDGDIQLRAQKLRDLFSKRMKLRNGKDEFEQVQEPVPEPEVKSHPTPPGPAYPGFKWRYRVLSEGEIEWQMIQKDKQTVG